MGTGQSTQRFANLAVDDDDDGDDDKCDDADGERKKERVPRERRGSAADEELSYRQIDQTPQIKRAHDGTALTVPRFGAAPKRVQNPIHSEPVCHIVSHQGVSHEMYILMYQYQVIYVSSYIYHTWAVTSKLV